MKFTSAGNTPPTPSFRTSNRIATEDPPCNQQKSHQISDPEHRHNSLDLIIGGDIENLPNHPHIYQRCMLTTYLAPNETCQGCPKVPFSHPFGAYARYVCRR